MKLHMTSGVASLAKKSKASFSGLGAQRSAIKLQKRLQYDNKRPKTSLLHWEFFKHGKVTTTIKVVNAENVRKMVTFIHLVPKLKIFISKVTYYQTSTNCVKFVLLFKELASSSTLGPRNVSVTNQGQQGHANNKALVTSVEQNVSVCWFGLKHQINEK